MTESIQLNGILDYNRTKGFGTSFGDNTRNIGAIAIKSCRATQRKMLKRIGIRKEASSDYESPFLFSLGSSYAFNSFTI